MAAGLSRKSYTKFQGARAGRGVLLATRPAESAVDEAPVAPEDFLLPEAPAVRSKEEEGHMAAT